MGRGWGQWPVLLQEVAGGRPPSGLLHRLLPGPVNSHNLGARNNKGKRTREQKSVRGVG